VLVQLCPRHRLLIPLNLQIFFKFPAIYPTSLFYPQPEDKLRYDKMFLGMSPVGGKLSGEKARPVMMASKLPVDALGKIWNLSDLDRDGQLDSEEFAVAMRLIQLCQAGELLPPSLPVSIIPLSKRTGVGVGTGVTGVTGIGGVKSLGTGIHPSPSSSPVPPTSSSSSPTLTRKQEWVVTEETKAKYDKYFEGIDKDKDGLVSGDEARGLFMASNLSSNILAHVWNLCDSQKKGKLNVEQFALAMYLIAEKVRGKELPTELAPNMIPPSLRGKSPLSSVAAPSGQALPPSFSSSSLSSVPATPSTTSLFPTSSSSSSIPLLPTMTSNAPPLSVSSAFGPVAPVPAGSVESGPASGGSGTGFGSDFSSIKELDTLTHEITGVKNEKVRLQEDIRLKQELIKTRKVEIESLQEESSTFMKQREDLEREKGQYLAKLEQLDTQRAQTESQIAEVKQKCRDEQEEVCVSTYNVCLPL
jgi:Ca2+-binding EF-hand superfamily protein